MCKNNKTSGWTALGGLRGLVGSQGELVSCVSGGICPQHRNSHHFAKRFLDWARLQRGPRPGGAAHLTHTRSRDFCFLLVKFCFFSVNGLFLRMQTLTAVQLVFCSAAFEKKKEKSSLKSFDPLSFQTRIAVWNCFQSASTPYNGPAMCKPGSSKTYTRLLPRTGLSQGVFCTKAAPAHFLDLCNLFPRTSWVMTDDKRQVQPINRGWRSVHGNGH